MKVDFRLTETVQTIPLRGLRQKYTYYHFVQPFSFTSSLHLIKCCKLLKNEVHIFVSSIFSSIFCYITLHPISGVTPYQAACITTITSFFMIFLFMMSAFSSVNNFMAIGHLGEDKKTKLCVHQRKGEDKVPLVCSRLIIQRTIFNLFKCHPDSFGNWEVTECMIRRQEKWKY